MMYSTEEQKNLIDEYCFKDAQTFHWRNYFAGIHLVLMMRIARSNTHSEIICMYILHHDTEGFLKDGFIYGM